MSFYLYKVLGALTEPMNLFAVLLILGALLTLLPWEGGQKAGRRLVFLLALFVLGMLSLPLGQWALVPLEMRYASRLPEKLDGIVMLTGDESPALSEDHGIPIGGFATQRHVMLARLARRYPKARLVVVGDTGVLHHAGKVTTKSLIQENLDAMGVPRERVEYETRSRTTRENAALTKEMVKPKEGQVWLLLTSAFHMPRSVLCFEKEGWKVVAYPTDYMVRSSFQRHGALGVARQIYLLDKAVHEYVGLVTYRLAGWTERFWP